MPRKRVITEDTWDPIPKTKGCFRNAKTGRQRVTWVNEHGKQKQESFAKDVDVDTLTAFRERMQRQAVDAKRLVKREQPADVYTTRGLGSFVRDAVRFLRTRRNRPCYKSDRSHMRPWVRLFGKGSRFDATKKKIMQAMRDWEGDGLSAREIRHRVNVLRQFFFYHDPDMPNPAEFRRGQLPKVKKTRPKIVPDDVIQTVAANLYKAELAGRLRDGKTRARYAVLSTTGKRPCQLMAAGPDDVDFAKRIWNVADAKGAIGGLCYLNQQQFDAWTLFRDANAWGAYDTSSYAKVLRTHGYPKGIRPYNVRHSTMQQVEKTPVDQVQKLLTAVLQQQGNHASSDTSHTFYAPNDETKARIASAALEGRFSNADMFAPRKRQKYDRDSELDTVS